MMGSGFPHCRQLALESGKMTENHLSNQREQQATVAAGGRYGTHLEASIYRRISVNPPAAETLSEASASVGNYRASSMTTYA